jgi:hypothetical protein
MASQNSHSCALIALQNWILFKFGVNLVPDEILADLTTQQQMIPLFNALRKKEIKINSRCRVKTKKGTSCTSACARGLICCNSHYLPLLERNFSRDDLKRGGQNDRFGIEIDLTKNGFTSGDVDGPLQSGNRRRRFQQIIENENENYENENYERQQEEEEEVIEVIEE